MLHNLLLHLVDCTCILAHTCTLFTSYLFIYFFIYLWAVKGAGNSIYREKICYTELTCSSSHTNSGLKESKKGREDDKCMFGSVVVLDHGAQPESNEWFIEDKAFLRLYYLAPPSPPPPFPFINWQQIVSVSQTSCVSPVELTDGIGGEGAAWGGSKTYDREKVQYSINHSILSLLNIIYL